MCVFGHPLLQNLPTLFHFFYRRPGNHLQKFSDQKASLGNLVRVNDAFDRVLVLLDDLIRDPLVKLPPNFDRSRL
jgi:hypothetical protein